MKNLLLKKKRGNFLYTRFIKKLFVKKTEKNALNFFLFQRLMKSLVLPNKLPKIMFEILFPLESISKLEDRWVALERTRGGGGGGFLACARPLIFHGNLDRNSTIFRLSSSLPYHDRFNMSNKKKSQIFSDFKKFHRTLRLFSYCSFRRFSRP